jgi:hypothetical protein
MDERDECLRSICDLGVVLDELVAEVLGDGRLGFAEVERRVQESAGGCLKFFLLGEAATSLFGRPEYGPARCVESVPSWAVIAGMRVPSCSGLFLSSWFGWPSR